MRYFNVSVCPVRLSLYPPFISTGSQNLSVFGMTREDSPRAETSVLRTTDDAGKLRRICSIATRKRGSSLFSEGDYQETDSRGGAETRRISELNTSPPPLSVSAGETPTENSEEPKKEIFNSRWPLRRFLEIVCSAILRAFAPSREFHPFLEEGLARSREGAKEAGTQATTK
jgi:hypothetical protein